MQNILSILILLFFSITIGKTQTFAPASRYKGTNAIYKDSSIFIDWAKKAELFRGYNNIEFPENGFTEYGTNIDAIGKSDGNPNVVSLGDGGSAILTFNSPITNGKGYDFAVFENGFYKDDTSELAFLELAFVEVSTNGIEYIRFPSVSELQTETQIGTFENINARYIHNFAGKYTMFYGTPFDLNEIKNLTIETSVNLNEINYVKIIDVVGTINDEFANYESKGNKVNDPFPTSFSSGGFDLDAVGVINNQTNTNSEIKILVRPNPADEFISIQTKINNIEKVEVLAIDGRLQILTNYKDNINIRNLQKGIYIIRIKGDGKSFLTKFIKN